MVEWCKRGFPFLILAVAALLPATFVFQLNLSIYPDLSDMTFETHLHDVFLAALILLALVAISGVMLYSTDLSLTYLRNTLSWTQNRRKVIRRMALGYLLLSSIPLGTVVSDSILPVFTPKVSSDEVFHSSQWEHDPLGRVYLFIDSEYSIPTPNNATYYTYRLVERRHFILRPWIPLVNVIHLRNPSLFSEISFAEPFFDASNRWKTIFASVKDSDSLTLSKEKSALRFQCVSGHSLNVSYWKNVHIPNLIVTYLEKRIVPVGKDTMSEMYVFIIRNGSDMIIEFPVIQFDRFNFAEVNPGSITLRLNGTAWSPASMTYRYRMNLGLWPTIAPNSSLNATITLLSYKGS